MLESKLCINNINKSTPEKLSEFKLSEKYATSKVGYSLNRVCRLQGLYGERLALKIKGRKQSYLAKLIQPGYSGSRHLHFIAMFSWISQTPMQSLFLHPKELPHHWGKLDEFSCDTITFCGILPQEIFIGLMQIFCGMSETKKHPRTQLVESLIQALSEYEDEMFMAPNEIDYDKFGRDYNRAVAGGLKRMRTEKNFAHSDMMEVFYVDRITYDVYENPYRDHYLPIEFGRRLQLGFNIESSVDFVVDMRTYTKFIVARKVQDLRVKIIAAIFYQLPSDLTRWFREFAEQTMYQFLGKDKTNTDI
ncbi:MAG: hypothetical protein COA42_04695 [Alteromonadaceae bacterium]|nr:MAG: hypothetical protein COA42_04695 [Alteromonadaceae bacterium]